MHLSIDCSSRFACVFAANSDALFLGIVRSGMSAYDDIHILRGGAVVGSFKLL
jgi:hypothetical protein